MRRWLLILVAAALPVVVIAQDDDAGDDRSRIVRFLEEQLSDGARTVRIDGFRGALSSTAELDRLSIADADGEWLILEDARLVWSRSALLSGELRVDEISAARLDLRRLPPTDDGVDLPPAEATPFALPELPVRVELNRLSIDRVDLGEPVIGLTAAFSVSGAARLADGDGRADLALQRLDGPRGVFDLAAGYANATGILDLDLLLEEAPNGLAAELLNLPDRPEINLQIAGTGPIRDFRAGIELDTDGEPRVSGGVELQHTEDGAQVILADIAGDLTPLMAPEYRGFFGEETRLATQVTLAADGSVALDDLDLRARAFTLEGLARLDPQRRPQIIDVTGRLADPGGDRPVRLPAAADATVREVTLVFDYDAAEDDGYTLAADLRDLTAEGLGIGDATFALNGQVRPSATGIGAITAELVASLDGLRHDDPALATALGPVASARATLSWAEGAPVILSDLSVTAGDVVAGGSASARPADGRIATTLDLQTRIGSLARFAGVVGQPLSGAAELTLTGTAEPLSGAFDLVFSGTGTDLRLADALPPRLFSGTTDLTVAALRDTTGLTLRDLSLRNAEVTASGAGTLSSEAAALGLDLRLRDVGLFTTALTGPATAEIDLTRRGALPWQLAADATGPGGLRAGISGGVGLPDNAVDLQTQGSLPLALANRFIAPRSINGTLGFDLAIAGQPGLGAVSGTLTASGARASAPNFLVAVDDIGLSGRFSGGRLSFDGSGRVSTGGRLVIDGSLDLGAGGLPGTISITADQARIVDPTLYEALIPRADITVTGALAGGPRIAGQVTLGETELRVPDTGLGGAAPIPPITHVGETAAERQTRAAAGLLARSGGGGSGPGLGLDLTISAPGRIFLRGRGIDAEFGGEIRLAGTTSQVIPIGRFELVRGRISVLGTRLDIAEGSATLQGSFDPFLTLRAISRSGGYQIFIDVRGPASAPEITFGSDPFLPEDEVLAQLLFGRSVSALSPVQLIQLADAASGLVGGSTEGGFLSDLRQGLGLDDLDLETDPEGNAAVRAGRYLSDNIYTDVTVGSGGEADLSLNIDLTPNITARGSFSSDGGSSIGVFFERDY